MLRAVSSSSREYWLRCAGDSSKDGLLDAELDGKVRGADVGLLYHPGRRGEAEVCARWKESLAALASDIRVRRNYPYAGKGDGLTTHLRLRFAQNDYIGIELEVNQGVVLAAGRRWTTLRRKLIDSLQTACAA